MPFERVGVQILIPPHNKEPSDPNSQLHFLVTLVTRSKQCYRRMFDFDRKFFPLYMSSEITRLASIFVKPMKIREIKFVFRNLIFS